MELIKITKKGSLHFIMKDGRIGVSYDTGHVRVSVRGLYRELYQINKVKKVYKATLSGSYFDYNYKRVLIPSQIDRLNMLLKFESKNCQ